MRRLLKLYLISFLLAALASANENLSLQNISPDRDVKSISFRKLDLFGDKTVGRIQAITQGPDDFMWIGTHQGLFRFDGQHIRAFRHDEQTPSSIPDDSIWALHFDSNDRLWIGTRRGLARYNPQLENFTNYLTVEKLPDPSILNQVNAVINSSDGTVYASTELGLVYRYDPEVDSFSPINGKPFGSIKSMTLDPQDRLWIGTNNALTRLDLKTGDRKIFVKGLRSRDEVSENYITSIGYISDEELWIGTSNNGLVLLNSTTEESSAFTYASQPESYINKISVDPQGRIWVANNAGISIYDQRTKKEIVNSSEKRALGAYPPSGITTIWVDHQGSVWVGSNYDGISRSSNTKRFEIVNLHAINPDIAIGDPASAFAEDKNGNLWVGNPKSGVAMYPKNGGPIKKFVHNPNDPNSITDQPILKLLEHSSGSIWMGSYRGGLFKYAPGSDTLVSFTHDPTDPYSIRGHDIRNLAEDANGDIWIATHGKGISRLDTKTERFYNYSVQDAFRSGFTILNDWVNSILIDDQQRIWLSTSTGVSRIDADKKKGKIYQANQDDPHSLSSSQTNQIIQDSKGRIWIATSDGLNLYLPEIDGFRSYSAAAGLPHQNICSIIEDQSGFLWMGTLDGLARFDPETGKANDYHVSDGLASNDFFEASVAKGADGALYFGQYRGLVRFHPSQIKDDSRKPNVFITGIYANSEKLEVAPQKPKRNSLKKSILFTDQLTLDHTQNSLTFEFIAIDYINPAENQYRYILEGFDQEWTSTKSRNEAVYTNLNPSNYTFRVQAANKDGYWNETGDSLAISIPPPFWSSLWFRLLGGLALIAFPATLVLWRIAKIKKDARILEIAVNERTADLQRANRKLEEANAKTLSQGEILERTVKQRTKELEIAKSKAERSDKLKSAFLANMSHEIRTPMNAIIGFLHILDNKDITETERAQFNNIIRQSSKSLMSLIDDILDLSAIEAGEADISPQPSNIDEICSELAALFRETISSGKGQNVTFKLNRQIPADLDERDPICIHIDPLRLKQILWNLISNAIKFTDEGVISLSYKIFQNGDSNGNSSIQFTVQDTGIGIPSEEHQQIFNRFHKLDKVGKKLYRGTGLGLTITQTLTELMQGHISVDSTPGVGTTFRVTFPFNPVDIQPIALHETKATATQPTNDFTGFQLLVVEDETPNFEYIQKVLKRTGATIHWAENGQKALDLFHSQPFDLVLLDLKIPEIDGYQVAREIRKTDLSIPIIAQSAYAMREDHLRSAEAGANEHLAKPFSPDQLTDTLARYLLAPTG